MKVVNPVLQEMRETGKHSDLTVICGDEKFKLHKNIMSTASTWFNSACSKRKWMEEEFPKVIELPSIYDVRNDQQSQTAQEPAEDFSREHPDSVRLMIDWIYLGIYDASTVLPTVRTVPQWWAIPTWNADSLPSRSYVNWDSSRKVGKLNGRLITESRLSKLGFSSIVDCFYVKTAKDEQAVLFVKNGELIAPAPPLINPGLLTMHARMYGLGGKYGIPGLQEFALKQFQSDTANQVYLDLQDLASAIRLCAQLGLQLHDSFVHARLASVLVDYTKDLLEDEEIRDWANRVDGLAWEVYRLYALKQCDLPGRE